MKSLTILVVAGVMAGCSQDSTNQQAENDGPRTTPSESPEMSYAERLEATKTTYPFERWHEGFQHGLEQYTEENCDKTRAIFDKLIADLIALGSDASESDKLATFEIAVLALNDLNSELDSALIETGEREDLCELCNVICEAAGMDPEKYGDGEGPASEWREW